MACHCGRGSTSVYIIPPLGAISQAIVDMLSADAKSHRGTISAADNFYAIARQFSS
jgi:hypothetical protein